MGGSSRHGAGWARGSAGDGADFRVLAPAASERSVLLGTPDGETREVPMTRCLNGAFLEAHVPGAREGDRYEYRIHLRDGGLSGPLRPLWSAGMELPARTPLRRVRPRPPTSFPDDAWMASRTACQDRPLHHLRAPCRVVAKAGAGPGRVVHLRRARRPAHTVTTNALRLHACGVSPARRASLRRLLGAIRAARPSRRPAAAARPSSSWAWLTASTRQGLGRYWTSFPSTLLSMPGASPTLTAHRSTSIPNDACRGRLPNGEATTSCTRVARWSSLRGSAADFWLGAYHFDGLRLDAVSRIVILAGR